MLLVDFAPAALVGLSFMLYKVVLGFRFKSYGSEVMESYESPGSASSTETESETFSCLAELTGTSQSNLSTTFPCLPGDVSS